MRALFHQFQLWRWARISPNGPVMLQGQLPPDHCLHHAHNGLHVRNAVLKCPIAMRTVLGAKEAKRRDGLPKRIIAQGREPLFNIINRLETSHAPRIPNLALPMQICGAFS